MKWNRPKLLESADLIEEYESKVGYIFPDDFKAVIKENNGARPELKQFKSKLGRRKNTRVFDHLLSFNKNDSWSIWDCNDWNGDMRDWNENGKMENFVAFAGDPFGDLICFDKTNDHIVFIDHETLSIEPVADSFSDFIASLKKIK